MQQTLILFVAAIAAAFTSCQAPGGYAVSVHAEAGIDIVFDGRFAAARATGPWQAGVEGGAGEFLLSFDGQEGLVVVADARSKDVARFALDELDQAPAWALPILARLLGSPPPE